MSSADLVLYLLRFYIPTAFSIAFRGFALGYTTRVRFALGFGVYTAYIAVVPALLITTIGYGQFTHISALVVLLGSFAVLIFTTDPPCKTIFMQLVQGSLTATLFVLLNMVSIVLDLSYPMLLVLLTISSPILYAVALRFWAKPLRFIADHTHEGAISLLALPVVTLVVVSLIPAYPPQSFSNHPVFCTSIMLAVELGFFLYLYTLYRNLCKISALSKQELQLELLQAEVASYQSLVEATRQNRHDLRHHDALILEHLTAGDIQGAKEYLRAHNKALTTTDVTLFCRNATASAVLRLYTRRAQEQGVVFSAMADIPADLPLTAPELGGLLGNLLENAMNACLRCTYEDQYIAFTAEVEDQSLLLELRNTALPDTVFRNGLPLSQKPDGGAGTRSIIDTVQRHDGIVVFAQQGTEFSARIILPLSEQAPI